MKKRLAVLTLFLLVLASTASASSISRQAKLTERLRLLRERLDRFQQENHKQNDCKAQIETVELKLEKISNELETRKDVKVITLFHDTEFSKVVTTKKTVKKKIVTVDELRKKMLAATNNTKRRADRIREMVASIR